MAEAVNTGRVKDKLTAADSGRNPHEWESNAEWTPTGDGQLTKA